MIKLEQDNNFQNICKIKINFHKKNAKTCIIPYLLLLCNICVLKPGEGSWALGDVKTQKPNLKKLQKFVILKIEKFFIDAWNYAVTH